MDKTHREAAAAEERVASVFRGRLTAASGSGTKEKADVVTDRELIEVKYTDRLSFSLKYADLDKLATYAAVRSRTPVFHVTFGTPGKRYVVLQENDFLDMRSSVLDDNDYEDFLDSCLNGPYLDDEPR